MCVGLGIAKCGNRFLRRVDLFLLIVHLLLLGVSLCLLRIGSGCLSGVNHALISGGSLHIPGGGNGFPGFVELLLLVSNIAAVLFDVVFVFCHSTGKFDAVHQSGVGVSVGMVSR